METAEVEGATTATFGKFLAQHSAFMQLRGVAYSKKHTSTGQVITLDNVVNEGSESDEGSCRVQQPAFIAFTAFIDRMAQIPSDESHDLDSKSESPKAALRP